jgi:hypothetical protein
MIWRFSRDFMGFKKLIPLHASFSRGKYGFLNAIFAGWHRNVSGNPKLPAKL